MKKAHQQLAAVSAAVLLMLSLFSVLLIAPQEGDGVTGFAERGIMPRGSL